MPDHMINAVHGTWLWTLVYLHNSRERMEFGPVFACVTLYASGNMDLWICPGVSSQPPHSQIDHLWVSRHRRQGRESALFFPLCLWAAGSHGTFVCVEQ